MILAVEAVSIDITAYHIPCFVDSILPYVLPNTRNMELSLYCKLTLICHDFRASKWGRSSSPGMLATLCPPCPRHSATSLLPRWGRYGPLPGGRIPNRCQGHGAPPQQQVSLPSPNLYTPLSLFASLDTRADFLLP